MSISNETRMFWHVALAVRSRDGRSRTAIKACEAIDDLEAMAMHSEGQLRTRAYALIQYTASKGATHPLRLCARVALERLDQFAVTYPAE